MSLHPCEHCGTPTLRRYCDEDCRLADKTGTGPKACAFIAGRDGHCNFHGRPADEWAESG